MSLHASSPTLSDSPQTDVDSESLPSLPETSTTTVQKKKPGAKPPRPCPECGLVLSGLTRHKQIVHGSGPQLVHRCAECNKTFGRKDHLTRHERIHDPQTKQQHPCPYCPTQAQQTFRRTDQLYEHMRVIHRVEPDVSCTGGAPPRQNPSAHRAPRQEIVENPDTPPLFECTVCGKPYVMRRDLRCHMFEIHGQSLPPPPVTSITAVAWARKHRRIYICPRGCGQRFTRPGYYQRHVNRSLQCTAKYLNARQRQRPVVNRGGGMSSTFQWFARGWLSSASQHASLGAFGQTNSSQQKRLWSTWKRQSQRYATLMHLRMQPYRGDIQRPSRIQIGRKSRPFVRTLNGGRHWIVQHPQT